MAQTEQAMCAGFYIAEDFKFLRSPFCVGGLGYGVYNGHCKKCAEWAKLPVWKRTWIEFKLLFKKI
jgi:hypothetical protein